MDTFEKIMLIIVFCVFASIPIYGYVCHLIGKKRMESGVDKRKLQYIMSKVVTSGENYTTAYASWYDVDFPKWGRHYTTSYWYYAIGFNDTRIYIVPLKFECGEIYYKNYYCVEKSMVAKVESEPKYGKIKFFDRNGNIIAHLHVEESNNYSHGNGNINLYQKEEFEAFCNLIVNWTSEINS